MGAKVDYTKKSLVDRRANELNPAIKEQQNLKISLFQRIYYPESINLKLYAHVLLDYVIDNSNEAKSLYHYAMEKLALPGCKSFFEGNCKYLDNHGGIGEKCAQDILGTNQGNTLPAELEAHYGDNADFTEYIEALKRFVLISFNRKDDITNGRAGVTLRNPLIEKTTELTKAAIQRTYADFYRHDIEAMQSDHIVHPAVESAIHSEKDTHLRRTITPFIKSQELKETNQQTLTKHAEIWYKCRVNPGSTEVYVSNESKRINQEESKLSDEQLQLLYKNPKYHPYPERSNIETLIAPFDEATGYPRKWRK